MFYNLLPREEIKSGLLIPKKISYMLTDLFDLLF